MSWVGFRLVLGLKFGLFGLVFGSRRDVEMKRVDSKLFWIRVICFGFKTMHDVKIE